MEQTGTMRTVAMDGLAPFLPGEIITHILKLLPVKSLIRFQCVCKHWKNLIRSPSFIVAHLHHSTQHRACPVFHQFLSPGRHLCLLDRERQIVRVQNIPVVDGTLWLVGSSSGLLCFRLDKYGGSIPRPPPFLLWNPSFREVRLVPTTSPDFAGHWHMGFGFSSIVNDYKIVRLYFSKNDHQVHLAEVYSLGVGSWKKIEVGNLGGLSMDYAGVTVNGVIFWFGFKQDTGEGREYVIVSFDIATEVFALIPGPVVKPLYGFHVTEFEHRLALLCSTLIGNSRSLFIELWVLEEGAGESGERWSWAKKHASIPSPCWLRPVRIWRNEIDYLCYLLCGDKGPELVENTILSNFSRTELEVLFDHVHEVFNYVESLVPVSNIHIGES